MAYKPFMAASIFLLGTVFAFAQAESQRNVPFEFGASYVGEHARVLKGGLKRGNSYEGMANLSLSFYTERAGWWKGGTFLVTGANTHGGTPSQDLIGDFQVASNIEAGNLTYLHECWYRQEFENWTLIAGLQDLNSEFVYTESGNLFLNSSFGTHSTIASNVPSPIFPLTSLGIQAQYLVHPQLMAKFAAFDGMPEDMDYNPHNISWHLNSKDGFLAFAELDVVDILKKPGVYKFGTYFHNHSFALTNSDPSLPNYGLYVSADQNLYATTSGRRLNLFLQFSASPSSINDNNRYLGCGIHGTGLLLHRPDDEVGIALAHANLQYDPAGSETVLEATYKLKVCDQVFVQPDVQCILHPNGASIQPVTTLVAFLRFGIEY